MINIIFIQRSVSNYITARKILGNRVLVDKMANKLDSYQVENDRTMKLSLSCYHSNQLYDFPSALMKLGIISGPLSKLSYAYDGDELPRFRTILCPQEEISTSAVLFSDEILISQHDFDGLTKDPQSSAAHDQVLSLVTGYLQNANHTPA